MSKQYGLIVSSKKKPVQSAPTTGAVKRPAIFDSDSDSDSEVAKPTGLKTTIRRQDRVLQQKAVEEDPTVFQYDELYDEMDAKRKESKLSKKDGERKPKYINKLLETAEKRKRENERRIERQVQKEREAEGEQFKDKESFVTSSYRAKLEELKKLEEEEKRQEYLESIGDVTKQGNLDGFYRHLYDQKGLYERETGNKDVKEEDTVNVKEQDKSTEKEEDKIIQKNEDAVQKPKKEKSDLKKRKYRKRNASSDEDGEAVNTETERPVLQHLPSNIDADSDFSIDSSDEDEAKTGSDSKKAVEVPKEVESNGDKKDEKVEEIKEAEIKDEQVEVVVPKKPKIDYWKKRTVGEIFDDSLRRYFERKSLREAGNYIRPVEILS